MDWEKKHQRGVHSVVAAWSRLELRYSGAGAPVCMCAGAGGVVHSL